jgi:hypothetical protein
MGLQSDSGVPTVCVPGISWPHLGPTCWEFYDLLSGAQQKHIRLQQWLETVHLVQTSHSSKEHLEGSYQAERLDKSLF